MSDVISALAHSGEKRKTRRGRRQSVRPRTHTMLIEPLEERTLLSLAPSLLKNINLTTPGSNPNNFVAVGDTMFFLATDGRSKETLWKSDGTETGTVKVKDLATPGLNAYISNMTAAGSLLFFTAFEPG